MPYGCFLPPFKLPGLPAAAHACCTLSFADWVSWFQPVDKRGRKTESVSGMTGAIVQKPKNNSGQKTRTQLEPSQR